MKVLSLLLRNWASFVLHCRVVSGLNESPELIAQELQNASASACLHVASMKVLSLLLRNSATIEHCNDRLPRIICER